MTRALASGWRQDLTAGAVLGLESVPDGLATGLLAGVNPLAGVYGYMVGTVAGALSTSAAFMAVQGTGAMGDRRRRRLSGTSRRPIRPARCSHSRC